jgi:hypothetical protein
MTTGESAIAANVSRDDVLAWRFSELLRAGYSWDDGLVLAMNREVELHTAVRLMRAGCPSETALRILL